MDTPNKHAEFGRQQLLTVGLTSAVGALGMTVAGLSLDHYMGKRGISLSETDEPEVITHTRETVHKTLVLMGGLCMGTQDVAGRFYSQLDEHVDLIAPIAPQSGFNPHRLFEKTYQKLEDGNPDEVLLLGLSMGGLLGWDFLRYGLEHGKDDMVARVSTMAFRATPIGKRAIRPGPRALLTSVGILGYSYMLDHHGRAFLQRRNFASVASAPASRVVPECKYLSRAHMEPLNTTPERLLWIRGRHPDPIIYEDVSIRALTAATGKAPEIHIDERSDRIAHMPTDRRSARFVLDAMGIATDRRPPSAQQFGKAGVY